MKLPRWQVPHVPDRWTWEAVPPLPPLVRSEEGTPAEQATTVRLAWDETALHVRFDCVDRHAWGTWTRRDDPLWQEEAVEVFLAPGAADPVDYLEFEVSPRGVLFDARIHNPTSLRADLRTDVAWDCPGVHWESGSGADRQDWWAVLELPWIGLLDGPPPPVWRANFYRIERPEGEPAEFSAWSPTLVRPADFHQPARFGVLELGDPHPRPLSQGRGEQSEGRATTRVSSSELPPAQPHPLGPPLPSPTQPPGEGEAIKSMHRANGWEGAPLSRLEGWEMGEGSGVRSGGGRLAGEGL